VADPHGGRPDAADKMGMLREIDDAPLSAYHRSILFRIWRRGVCTQTLRSLAADTGMSLGKCQQVVRDLLVADWLVEAIHNGRDGWRIATAADLPDVPADVHHMNTDVHVVNTDVHVVNTDVHVVNTDVHLVNADVHLVNNLYCINTPGNTPGNTPVNTQVLDGVISEPAPAPSPKHLRGFNALWQESEPIELTRRSVLIRKLVRNVSDVEGISAAASLSIELGVTDEEITQWFGAGGFWFTQSFGLRNGFPPYAKNVLNELATAQAWSKTAPVTVDTDVANFATEF